ncbi:hypothetical protein SLE2022_120800 [Rubroshorea leprosula]
MADTRSSVHALTSSAATLGSSVTHSEQAKEQIRYSGEPSRIELPQMAVVGSQSSGKSSFLEARVANGEFPNDNEINQTL